MTETQGLVVLEALAGGTPVIAVHAPGIGEIILDGITGYLTFPDEGEFSKRVLELIQDNEKRTEFSRNALIRAGEFSLERCTAKLIGSYEKLIKMNSSDLNRSITPFLSVQEFFKAHIAKLSDEWVPFRRKHVTRQKAHERARDGLIL
ncbi:glycosyltransferase [candidate division KSB1 bacterium]|nr:glycosyltransferase [candidate division KSB1 bacterium]